MFTDKNGNKYLIENRTPKENELAKLPNGHIYAVEKIVDYGMTAILDAPKWYRRGSIKSLRTAILIIEDIASSRE